MRTQVMAPVDRQLREAVIEQLNWDPEVDDTDIGIVAHDGAVTLTGFIDTYAGKLAAERAVKRVRGVRAVANDVEVRVKFIRADDEIAEDAARALKLRSTIPDTVQAAVRHGHVTLTGKVAWLYQKYAAADVIRHLRGVISITNHIDVMPEASPRDVRHRIVAALHRIADVNASRIRVIFSGHTAMLTGSVSSWAQREAAERAVSQAPGIEKVENLIEVQVTDI